MLSPIASAGPRAAGCRIAFGSTSVAGAASAGTLHLPVPVLAGSDDDLILPTSTVPETREELTVYRTDTRLAGFFLAKTRQDLDEATRRAYQQILGATEGWSLYRVWNFVPEINAHTGGLENYRRFCRGRSMAFEQRFGSGFAQQLSAASAVGCRSGNLAVAFVAGNEATEHFENPVQVPAFEYPAQYGPRPPSFARATAVAGRTTREIFVSGTAAIRGHRSLGTGDLGAQIACTIENLRLIATAAGAGREFGAADGWRRLIKIYLRHRADLAAASRQLGADLLRPSDTVQYLEADICRAELLIEIEAILSRDA